MTRFKDQNQLLDTKIRELQLKRERDFQILKLQFETTTEELRPSRLLSRAINDVREEPQAKNNLFESLLSLGGGYFSKKILVGKSNSVFKNLIGYTIQYFTTKFISKNLKT